MSCKIIGDHNVSCWDCTAPIMKMLKVRAIGSFRVVRDRCPYIVRNDLSAINALPFEEAILDRDK